MFRLRASDFLCGQKVTKEPSKGRGISISLSPLKSPLLETTKHRGDCGPPIGCTPWSWQCPGRFSGESAERATKRAGGCGTGPWVRLTDCFRESHARFDGGASTRAIREGRELGASFLAEVSGHLTGTERQRLAHRHESWSLPRR